MSPGDRHRWVITLDLGAHEKAVLHVLANRADAESLTCFMSIETLAHDSGASVRKARSVVRELERSGLISTRVGGGAGRASSYTLAIDETRHRVPSNSEKTRHRLHENPAQIAQKPGTACRPTGIEQVNEQGERRALTESMIEFARGRGLGDREITEQWDRLIDYKAERGERVTNPEAAWRKWIRTGFDRGMLTPKERQRVCLADY